ncbi:MAG: ATP-dependent RecD-like DNA helicase [Eubacteriales bacterium]|jgi:exodeoxyribonuclease V alpha subunit|nr:ATP-dependent RecD-like DNA helicase [Eubacteriales bacterium]
MGQHSDKISIKGIVEEVVYYNSENCYAVCYIETQSEYTAVVGYLPYISEGDKVIVTGNWTTHAEYGRQFKADYYEKDMPKEKDDILRYLASGIIKGVRRATAEKIVNHFGDKSLDIIAGEPLRLAEIKGISERKALEIGESYAKQIGVRDIVIFLQKYGISPNLAAKVYKHYGTSAIDVIKSNPYLLSQEVYGIGFKTADKIALSMGMSKNAPERIQAATSFALWEGVIGGHTFLPRGVLIQNTVRLVGADGTECDSAITQMLFAGRLFNEIKDTYEAIYLPSLYNAEIYAASKLHKIASVSFTQFDVDIDEIISNVEAQQGITLAREQREAVYLALKNGVLVITGGPGTGKTTIINAIIKVMESLGKNIMLAAPTGRAANRMTELCGMEAMTIHRLLEVGFSEDGDGMSFYKDESNPLECDVLIIDEMSMVDVSLLSALLKAVKVGTRLVLVGDGDQLASVGAGDVLRDIISSGAISVIRLTEIFRQAKESMIVVNAHKINKGEYPVLNQRESDFFIVHRNSGEEIANTIVDLCKNRLPKTYGYDPLFDIQVLTPTRKGITGVTSLNERLQQAFNPPSANKKEKKFKNIVFREGDKVMQIKNNYETEWERSSDGETGVGVFNGEIGFIEKIDFQDESMSIIFDDRKMVYGFSELDELDLAYAITVHKSQGSEYDAVVMPMYPTAPMLLNRNLLYTAVTRAKKLVVMVGRENVIKTMTDNINEHRRYSGLSEKLRSFL